MTVYDLPALVAIAYTNAVTPSNIQAYQIIKYLNRLGYILLTDKFFLTQTFCHDAPRSRSKIFSSSFQEGWPDHKKIFQIILSLTFLFVTL